MILPINRKASVLVMVTWALTLLSLFALQIGLMTRDKISFLARVERSSILRAAAKGGVAKALAVIKTNKLHNTEGNFLQTSITLYHNPGSFRDLDFGQARVSVVDSLYEKRALENGVTDEGGRLNLNTADKESIKRLLLAVGIKKEDEAEKLASAIYDWRYFGESEVSGFSSDSDYDNREFPYEPTKSNFQTLDELRLVNGVTEDIYKSFIDYVTIYGDKAINLNTASWQVLFALGLTQEQAVLAVSIRKGPDGIEGNIDDIFYTDNESLINKVQSVLSLSKEDLESFKSIVRAIVFDTDKDIFRIYSQAKLLGRDENKSITCVFNLKDDKIIYWSEQSL